MTILLTAKAALSSLVSRSRSVDMESPACLCAIANAMRPTRVNEDGAFLTRVNLQQALGGVNETES